MRAFSVVLQDCRTPRDNEGGMHTFRNCKLLHPNHQSVMGLALARYNFSTPEIRLLMRHVLEYAVSGRTIKRLVRSTGRRLKRGRPLSTPRIHKGDVNYLIELTGNCAGSFNGNVLQFFQEIHVRFGLTPQQYLKWVAKSIRRGKCMMRSCLLCNEFFASMDSSERHCKACQANRRRLVNEERRSSLV